MLNSLCVKIIKVIVLLVLMTAFLVLLAVWDTTSQTVHRNIYGSLQKLNGNLEKRLLSFAEDKRQQIALYFSDDEHASILLGADSIKTQSLVQELNTLFAISFIINDNKLHYEPTIDKAVGTFSEPEALLKKISALHARPKKIDNTQTNTPFFLYHNDEVYMLVIQAIETIEANPKPIQIISGYHINQQWLKDLANDVGLNLSLLVSAGKQHKLLTSITTIQIDKDELESGLVSSNYLDLLKPAVLLGYQDLFTSVTALNNMIGAKGAIYLSINAERVSSNFIKLQLKIGTVALLAVIIAGVFGIYLARKIAKPIELVAQYSSNIAKGQYKNKTINKVHFKELDLLIGSFEQMQSEIAQREEDIVFQAQHDAVTKIHNRKYIRTCVEQKFGLDESFQAIAVNLSDFRHINDVFGYELGDKCLTQIAKRMSELTGISARLTGGKFVWLPSKPQSEIELKRILSTLNQAIETNGVSIPVKVVMGQLNCPEEAKDSETFFRRLAIVLERAKQQSLVISRFSADIEENYLRRLAIISNLRKALAFNQQELSLAYQPKLSLKGSATKKLEALIRWTNPNLGFVPPDEFIQIAEDAGLITTLTSWVIDTAINDILVLRQDYDPLEIAINISIADVSNPQFVPYLSNKMAESGLPTHCLTLELTESQIAKEPEKVIASLVDIKNSGFSIAIDDFGTGYSSLSYLSQFPADTLKFDKSFVMTLATSKTNQIMCKRILQLASDFCLEVVAEGIEDEQSLKHLKEHGCDWAQGFHICKPCDLDSIKEWLKAN